MSSLGWHGSKLVEYCKEVIALPATLLCGFVYGALLGPRSTTGVKAARESRNMSVSDTDTFTAGGAETPTTERFVGCLLCNGFLLLWSANLSLVIAYIVKALISRFGMMPSPSAETLYVKVTSRQ